MAHLYLSPETDSLYLDVTAGSHAPVTMTAVADGVYLHVDEGGELVAIEVLRLSERGGLEVDDLDADPSEPRPAMFDVIERRAGEASAPPRHDP